MKEFVLRRDIRVDVSAQREYILDAVCFEFLYLLINIRMGGIDAGEVRDGLGAAVFLYSSYEVYRGSTRSGSTCAVCDADEIRVQVAKLFQRVVNYGNIVVLSVGKPRKRTRCARP